MLVHVGKLLWVMCHVYQIVFVAAIYTPRPSSKKDG